MRTSLLSVQQSSRNQKFSVTFVTHAGEPGDEYVMNECESAAVFATEEAAYAGGARALTCLEQTGRYPNMCEVF